MGALLAATIAVTSPMAYAAPFDTDTGLAPLGTSHLQSGITLDQSFWAFAVGSAADIHVFHKPALALWHF